jgi:hypothetical protein
MQAKAKELFEEYLRLRDEAFGLKNGKTNPIRALIYAFKKKDRESISNQLQELLLQAEKNKEDFTEIDKPKEIEAFFETFPAAVGGLILLMEIKIKEQRDQKFIERSVYNEYYRKYIIANNIIEYYRSYFNLD